MSANAVSLAAQADLVLLTAEMLRAPSRLEASGVQHWYELPLADFDELLRVGLGNVAENSAAASARPSPHSALADVHRCAQALELQAWSDEYWRMFDGATACPLNQASYIRRDKGTILGDLSGFYRAFGFRGGTAHGERPDHLLCQLEFLGMLLALASQASDSDQRDVVMHALSSYAREHMHDWLPSVCWQMCEQAEIEYFAAVAQWLMVLWEALAELHAWPADRLPDQHMQPITDPENPYECGAPDLHQIQAK